jgi:pyocin large subunit-like protein
MGVGTSARSSGDPRGGKSGKVAATAFFPGKLEEHYDRHIDDFDVLLTIEEYEAMAKSFFAREPTQTTEFFYDIDGVLYKYDTKTNEFGMCTASGVMITYFLPKNKLSYWYRQVAQYAI